MNVVKEISSPWNLPVLLIIALVSITEIAIDMFLPSLPYITNYFSSIPTTSQLCMSFYIFGIGGSSLFYGVLSDCLGRRVVLLWGIGIFCIGSLMCYISQSLFVLIISRCVQGLGAGVALSVGIPVIKDLYSANKTASIMSQIGMVIAISPGLAPVIGGYIALFFGWRAVFLIIFVVGCFLWLLYFVGLPETNKEINSTNSESLFKSSIYSYLELTKNIPFLYFALIHSIVFAFTFSEAVTLPFLYMQVYSIPQEKFGYFMAFTISIYVIGAYVNKELVIRKGIKKMLKIGLWLYLFSCIILTILAIQNCLTPYLIQIIKIPGTIGVAFIFGNAIPQSLEFCKNSTGAGSSFICFMQMLLAVLITFLVTILYNNSALSLYGVSFMTGCICLYALKRGYKLPFNYKRT